MIIIRFFKNTILNQWLFLFFLLILLPRAAPAQEPYDYFAPLQDRLIKDGFDEKMIKSLYARSRVKFDTRAVSLYFVHQESNVDYDQYSGKTLIKRARQYMKKYRTTLSGAEKLYGVDKTVITAIILVETQFGRLLGSSNVLNTLSTMAALFDGHVRDILWEQVSDTPELTRKIFNQKSNAKAEWAYEELKAFLYHAILEDFDPVKIRGSFAGAMGIAQFMPSNIFYLAKDGNEDGRIDLFNHADAIYSIAFYLVHHGWKPGLSKKEAAKVIYHYNHSEQYVNTILKISSILKGKKRKK